MELIHCWRLYGLISLRWLRSSCNILSLMSTKRGTLTGQLHFSSQLILVVIQGSIIRKCALTCTSLIPPQHSCLTNHLSQDNGIWKHCHSQVWPKFPCHIWGETQMARKFISYFITINTTFQIILLLLYYAWSDNLEFLARNPIFLTLPARYGISCQKLEFVKPQKHIFSLPCIAKHISYHPQFPTT